MNEFIQKNYLNNLIYINLNMDNIGWKISVSIDNSCWDIIDSEYSVGNKQTIKKKTIGYIFNRIHIYIYSVRDDLYNRISIDSIIIINNCRK